jgi:16S rRNA U1498 N3-methylase RsmE
LFFDAFPGQCRDTILPEVFLRQNFDKFVKELPKLTSEYDRAFFCHPDNDDQGRQLSAEAANAKHAQWPMESAVRAAVFESGRARGRSKVIAAVGPEGRGRWCNCTA